MSKVVTNLHEIVMQSHSTSRQHIGTPKKSSVHDDKYMVQSSCRQLFVPRARAKSTDCYINYNRMSTPLYDGRSKGISIPEWILILFRPPTRMILNEVEAGIVAHVFGRNKDFDRYLYLLMMESFTGFSSSLIL
ncbi:unnamed protein product [Cuscuta campestris]|uniref:Uncharacterized protein n=1 Tax=Cuscuta campestris TaxID=132261 RepID=A0A484LTF1_9ASTE|nr:unnamed protein product [Cuscuta campestris]